MTDSRPPGEGRQALTNWAVDLVRQLTLQNILVVALLAVVAAPSYFAWKFMSDTDFRHEFTSHTEIVDAGVPCLVLLANLSGGGDRYTVAASYDIRDRLEYLIAIRSPGVMSNGEIAAACTAAHADADLLRAATQERDRQKLEKR